MTKELNSLYLPLALIVCVYLILATSQRITTQPRVFHVKVGDTVELPCNAEKVDLSEVVVMWKRGNDILFIDDDEQADDNRFEVHREGTNVTMIINKVEPYDTAEYSCEITTNPVNPLRLTHKVQIDVPPSLKVTPDSPVFARQGEEVVLKCTASGNPRPKVEWRRRGEKIRAGVDYNGNGRLRIPSADITDSGLYECVGSNGVGGEVKTLIEIRIESRESDESVEVEKTAPWAETDRLYIPTSPGADINLTCRYNGEPSPTTEWLYNSFRINSYDAKFQNTIQYATRRENYSETIFALKNVQEDNFGDYTCRISNNLGTAERTIHLSGRPGPPALLLRGNELSWTVESVEPIIEYKLHYRLAREDTWTGHKTFKTSKEDQHGALWQKTVKLDFLKSDTDYEIQLTAKNKLGHGSFARNYLSLKTPPAPMPDGKRKANTASGGSTSIFSTFLTLTAAYILYERLR